MRTAVIILLCAILPGCVTLETRTKYGTLKVGTDGEMLTVGYTK